MVVLLRRVDLWQDRAHDTNTSQKSQKSIHLQSSPDISLIAGHERSGDGPELNDIPKAWMEWQESMTNVPNPRVMRANGV